MEWDRAKYVTRRLNFEAAAGFKGNGVAFQRAGARDVWFFGLIARWP